MGSGLIHADKVLDMLAGVAPAAYGTHYMSWHTGNPGGTGANEVPAAFGYARVALLPANYGPPTGTPNVDRHRPYTVQIDLGPASGGAWGLCTHWGLWTAATGGSFIKGGTLSPAINVTDGTSPFIPAGEFKPEQD